MYSIFEVQRSVEDWKSLEAHVWLTWAIFNPSGPTLYALGCVNRKGGGRGVGFPGCQEVFFRWMHFMGGKTYVLGYMEEDEPNPAREIARILARAFEARGLAGRQNSMLVNSVPAWVSLGALSTERALVMRDLMQLAPGIREADWGCQRYLLDRHGPDLFGRAGEEARIGYETQRAMPGSDAPAVQDYLRMYWLQHQHLPTFKDWNPEAFRSRPLAPDDVEYWWHRVTSADFLSSALVEFAQAWVGAAYLRGHELPVKERFSDVREFLLRADHPLWPAEWTDEYLRASMSVSAPR